MSKDTDGVNFVTDDNTGGYYVCECQGCGEVFSSRDCGGGGQIADTGDYDDTYCPHCDQVDPLECDNPALVWNVQQKKINELLAALASAREMVGEWGDYASDYFKKKHNLAGDLSEIDTAIAKAKGGAV